MTAEKAAAPPLIVETQPRLEDIQFLQDGIGAFNAQATGAADARVLALFLRTTDGAVTGGVFGWSWGATCYIRYVYLAADMRRQGHGTRLMRAVETEAKLRGCHQIMLETFEFRAPGFYQKLGFEVVGRVPDYPRGHEFRTLVKRIG
jgi:GNAT superfamily N-acetyltransferase